MSRFENSKWLHHSNRNDFETITITIDSIPTELSNENSDDLVQSSSEELQYINRKASNMSNLQLEEQLEKIKQLYMNQTGKTVIDKRYLE